MRNGKTFRIRSGDEILFLRKLDDFRAEIVDPATSTFAKGDVVAPFFPFIDWEDAGRRLTRRETELSPQDLVLVRPREGWPALSGGTADTGETPGVTAAIHDFEAYRAKASPEPTPAA